MKVAKAHMTSIKNILPWVILGFLAGLINGLLGAAGGILLVTLLPYLAPPSASTSHLSPGCFADNKNVMVTSLCVMLPITAVSAVLYWMRGNAIGLELSAIIALPAAAGGLLGAYLLGKIPRDLLRKLFGLLVAISGVRMLWG